MSDWMRVIEPMERELARLLGRQEVPEPTLPLVLPSLARSLPAVEELLTSVVSQVSEAEQVALQTEALLEEASGLAQAWKNRLQALRDHAAPYDNVSDPPPLGRTDGPCRA